jgi:hypothetical protein
MMRFLMFRFHFFILGPIWWRKNLKYPVEKPLFCNFFKNPSIDASGSPIVGRPAVSFKDKIQGSTRAASQENEVTSSIRAHFKLFQNSPNEILALCG